jgi:hypothetical protein
MVQHLRLVRNDFAIPDRNIANGNGETAGRW